MKSYKMSRTVKIRGDHTTNILKVSITIYKYYSNSHNKLITHSVSHNKYTSCCCVAAVAAVAAAVVVVVFAVVEIGLYVAFTIFFSNHIMMVSYHQSVP